MDCAPEGLTPLRKREKSDHEVGRGRLIGIFSEKFGYLWQGGSRASSFPSRRINDLYRFNRFNVKKTTEFIDDFTRESMSL
jgi:hypothetical protein